MNTSLSIIAGLFSTICLAGATTGMGGVPAAGKSGMVSSAHPLASDAGVKILRAGGNAFDAAVAVAAALNVVEPDMSGIGGYGTIMLYDAGKHEARFLNPSGRIPAGVDPDAFRPPTPDYEGNRRGAKAVSTPGNVHAWESLWKAYGTMKWAQLLEPAVQLAANGFSVGKDLGGSIAAAWPSFPADARAFYGQGDRPLKEGEVLTQKDLARSLEIIAREGAGAVYGGSLGRAIDRAMREQGGFLRLEDLRAHRSEWWKPIRISYRGCEVVTASPPANTFDYLVRLGMMEQFDNASLGHNTAAYLHRFAEVTKHGFWVRLRYAGDPEILPPPLEMLLSAAYWKDEVRKLDLENARPFVPPQAFAEAGDSHTTHFVVADRWGNVVSATQTLGNAFGARIMPAGTGFWLNNSLAYCTFEPKGNPMDAHPGRRKLSGDCPTIILKDGRPWVAIGTPGGHTIGQTVPQMVINLVDFKMDIAAAIAAARVSFVEPDALGAEPGVAESVREALARMGHKILLVSRIGNAHGLVIEYDAAGKPVRFSGAADPRGGGRAVGY